MTAAGEPVPPNSSCPRCGAAFRCGMVAGDNSECWCAKLPHVMPVDAPHPPSPLPSPAQAGEGVDHSAASCFCPTCLQKITNDQQHNA